jgi:hypothetical protein
MNLRKIDALVLEHVLGWKELQWRNASDKFLGGFYGKGPDGQQHVPLNRMPTTSISAAMMIPNTFKEYQFEISIAPEVTTCTILHLSGSPGLNRVAAIAAAKTTPLAICLVALKFRGVEWSETELP